MSSDMSGITEKTEWAFGKNINGYYGDVNNYVIPRELTVTITLAEYRDLIQSDAKSELDKERSVNCDLRIEIKDLKKKIADLEKALGIDDVEEA